MRRMRMGRHMRAALALSVFGLALAGCGVRADLKPKPGHLLPGAPYGRSDRPGSRELLTGSAEQRPGNSTELRTKSEQRPDDPFDLPPQ